MTKKIYLEPLEMCPSCIHFILLWQIGNELFECVWPFYGIGV